jgi:hypothetical protein
MITTVHTSYAQTSYIYLILIMVHFAYAISRFRGVRVGDLRGANPRGVWWSTSVKLCGC